MTRRLVTPRLLQLIQVFIEQVAVAAWTIHAQVHALPEIRANKIIGMACQHELPWLAVTKLSLVGFLGVTGVVWDSLFGQIGSWRAPGNPARSANQGLSFPIHHGLSFHPFLLHSHPAIFQVHYVCNRAWQFIQVMGDIQKTDRGLLHKLSKQLNDPGPGSNHPGSGMAHPGSTSPVVSRAPAPAKPGVVPRSKLLERIVRPALRFPMPASILLRPALCRSDIVIQSDRVK